MPLPLMNHSALALFAQRTRIPTSARSIGFCVIWVCISSSSSTRARERRSTHSLQSKRVRGDIGGVASTDSAWPVKLRFGLPFWSILGVSLPPLLGVVPPEGGVMEGGNIT